MNMPTAIEVLTHYWPEARLPIDPNEIAVRAGLTITPLSFDEWDVSGKYEENSETQSPTIYFNPTESETRQRFTIAHELGHHFLRHGPRYRDTRETFNNGYSPIEVSANRFAADLLMPKIYLEIAINKKGITSPTQLSELFFVSEKAMIYRLKNLGFF